MVVLLLLLPAYARSYKSEAWARSQFATAQRLHQSLEARPAEISAKPADFANASPFPNRKKETDNLGRAIFAAAAFAILALLLSLLNLLRLHGPESFIR